MFKKISKKILKSIYNFLKKRHVIMSFVLPPKTSKRIEPRINQLVFIHNKSEKSMTVTFYE